MKRFISLFIAIVMIFSFVIPVFAVEETAITTKVAEQKASPFSPIIKVFRNVWEAIKKFFQNIGKLIDGLFERVDPEESTTSESTIEETTEEPTPITRPTKKVYDITVTKQDNTKILTVDGVSYDLKNSDDIAALKVKIEAENANDLLGQLYDVDPTIAAFLGLAELGGGELSYNYDADGEFFYIDDMGLQQQISDFNPLYDFGAGFVVMYYDTVRIKFNYKNVGYMLQLWKGQYGLMFIGSEIGFYKKADNTSISTNPTLDIFEPVADVPLQMEMSCYRVESEEKLNPLFNRKYECHWWNTGFVPGLLKRFNDRSELVVEAKITLKDAEMTRIVADTFKANGFTEIEKSEHNIYNPDTYFVNGNDIVFVWRYIQHKKDVTILAPTTTSSTTTELLTTDIVETTSVN